MLSNDSGERPRRVRTRSSEHIHCVRFRRTRWKAVHCHVSKAKPSSKRSRESHWRSKRFWICRLLARSKGIIHRDIKPANIVQLDKLPLSQAFTRTTGQCV